MSDMTCPLCLQPSHSGPCPPPLLHQPEPSLPDSDPESPVVAAQPPVTAPGSDRGRLADLRLVINDIAHKIFDDAIEIIESSYGHDELGDGIGLAAYNIRDMANSLMIFSEQIK